MKETKTVYSYDEFEYFNEIEELLMYMVNMDSDFVKGQKVEISIIQLKKESFSEYANPDQVIENIQDCMYDNGQVDSHDDIMWEPSKTQINDFAMRFEDFMNEWYKSQKFDPIWSYHRTLRKVNIKIVDPETLEYTYE